MIVHLDRQGLVQTARRTEYIQQDIQALYRERQTLQKKREQHLLDLGKTNTLQRGVTALNVAYGGITAMLMGNPLALIPSITSTVHFLLDQTGQYGKIATFVGAEEKAVRSVMQYIDMAAGAFNLFSNGATIKGTKKVVGEASKIAEGLLGLKRTQIENVGTDISAERDQMGIRSQILKGRESECFKLLQEALEQESFFSNALIQADKIEGKMNKKIAEANQ